jgi:hypothetical protein
MTDQPLPVASENQSLLIGDTRLRRLLIGGFGLVLLIGCVILIANWHATSWDFRNNLWGPTYLLINGQNPYLLDSLFEVGNPIWMPTIIGALFPLGWLSEPAATALWFLASIGCLIGIYKLSIGSAKVSLGLMTLLLVSGFCFMPTVSHFVLGQFGLFAALLMLIALLCAKRGQWILAGVIVALATAKPQLILLPVLGLAVYAWTHGGWRTLLRFGLSSVIAAVLLTIPLWIASPNWIEGLQIAFSRNLAWAQPSSLVTLRLLLGSIIGIVLWLVLLAVGIGATVRLWRRIDALTAMCWSLFLTLLVSPYAWSWDFVLVLPLWFHLMATGKSWIARGVLLVGYVITWVGTVMIRLGTNSDEINFWWFPWVWLVIFMIATLIARKKAANRLQSAI